MRVRVAYSMGKRDGAQPQRAYFDTFGGESGAATHQERQGCLLAYPTPLPAGLLAAVRVALQLALAHPVAGRVKLKARGMNC